MINVRPATHEDTEEAIALGRQMHEETEYVSIGFDAEKMANNVGPRWINNPDYCLFVAEDEGEIIGLFAGFITEHYFSTDLLAKDLLFYVRKDKRGGRAALMLMDAFMRWVSDYPQPIKAVIVGTSSGKNHSERAGRFFIHYGMEQIGNLYRRIN